MFNNRNNLDTNKDSNFLDSIALYFKTSKRQIIPFSCNSNLLFSLLSSLHSKNIYLYTPIDTIYENYLSKLNFNIFYINRLLDNNIEIIPNSIILFTNPAQPDGTYYNLDNLFHIWKERKLTIILNESYIEFTTKKSYLFMIREYSKLYIIRDLEAFFSKNTTISLLFSNQDNIKMIKTNNQICSISNEQKNILINIFKDTSFKKVAKTLNIIIKEEFTKECLKLPFINEIFPSSTNYCLISLKYMYYEDIKDKLGKFSHLVKNGANFYPLDNSYIQITFPKYSQKNELLQYLYNIKK